jgi:acyl transferase domain-containing protein
VGNITATFCPLPLTLLGFDAVGQDMPVRHGSFVRNVYHFDAGAFGISPSEATLMDPQQRVLLELVLELLQPSGGSAPHSPPAPPAQRSAPGDAGAFVGISTPDYAELTNAHSRITPYSAAGSAMSVAPGRVSYLFGLRGPSVSVDTACSSALVGLHMGRLSLEERSCSAVVASGAGCVPSSYPKPRLALIACPERARLRVVAPKQ